MQFLLPLLESGAGASLLSALGGTAAGTPMTGGMQGATQGSGLFGALSGGGMNPLMGSGKSSFNPYLGVEGGNKEDKQPSGYQFTQQRFRPTSY